jgi:hypothetical protein
MRAMTEAQLATSVARIRLLADHIRQVPAELFNMGSWWRVLPDGRGAGCVVGHAADCFPTQLARMPSVVIPGLIVVTSTDRPFLVSGVGVLMRALGIPPMSVAAGELARLVCVISAVETPGEAADVLERIARLLKDEHDCERPRVEHAFTEVAA